MDNQIENKNQLYDVFYNSEVDSFWLEEHIENPKPAKFVERIVQNLPKEDAEAMVKRFTNEF